MYLASGTPDNADVGSKVRSFVRIQRIFLPA